MFFCIVIVASGLLKLKQLIVTLSVRTTKHQLTMFNWSQFTNASDFQAVGLLLDCYFVE